MGAAAALLAAPDCPAIQAVVADSAFARLDGMAEERLRVLPAALRHPLAGSSQAWAERFSGCCAAVVSPVEAVRRMTPRPILIIHGGRDELIPVAHARQLYAAARGPRELWIVPGARHVCSHAREPGAYEQRVVTFFRQYLQGESRKDTSL
jgi:uncharacterized protein